MKPTVSLCFALLVSFVAADFTWWVDSTCDNSFPPGVFDKIMSEVPVTAQMVWDRISRTKEEEPQAYEAYEALFHYNPRAPDIINMVFYERFKAILRTINKFTKEPLAGEEGRKASELRIYCDNDDRMELANPDEKDPEEQEWMDKINKVSILGIPSCKYNDQRNDGRVTVASTIGMVKKQDVEGENENRVSVTICDYWLNIAGRINTWEEANLQGSTFPDDVPGSEHGTAVDSLGAIGSQIMYHEMMHLSRNQRVDHKYDIRACVPLSNLDASMNANSHAIYGGIVRVMETKNKLGGPTWGDGDLHEDATIPDRVPSNPPLGQEDQPSSKDKRGPLVTCDEGVEKAELKGLICKEFAA